MMPLEQIRNFFPPDLRNQPAHQKYLVKEYVQFMTLDFLSTTRYVEKITFIGGTNLRLVKGIDRFSEDLDFDCKQLSNEEFNQMTDSVLSFLQLSGLRVEIRDKKSDNLKAFRRNFFFPELLFELGLSGYREERFLLKVECQDQQVDYSPVIAHIKGCGFFFPFPVPPDGVLCAMKLSALLSRQKGRDFYDAMFLMGQTSPDMDFLSAKCGIHNQQELKTALFAMLENVNLTQKSKDFEHLLFNKNKANKILTFSDFIKY
jgi:predicted nucleotidyltransferase component of viral defense system